MIELQIFDYINKNSKRLNLSKHFIAGFNRIYKKYRLYNFSVDLQQPLFKNDELPDKEFHKQLKLKADSIEKSVLLFSNNALLPYLEVSLLADVHALTQFVDMLDHMTLLDVETRILLQRECYESIRRVTGEMLQVFSVYDKYIEKVFNVLKIEENDEESTNKTEENTL